MTKQLPNNIIILSTLEAELRERERVNNARGVFDFFTSLNYEVIFSGLKNFLTSKHYFFNGAFLLFTLLNSCGANLTG